MGRSNFDWLQLDIFSTTASLPDATLYKGAITYDGQVNLFKGSNGTTWLSFGGSGATPTADDIYNNGAWTVTADANDITYTFATGYNMVLKGAAAGTTANALVIDDNGGTLTKAIEITGSNAVTTAIDVSDAQIGNALVAGANDLSGTSWSITGATGAVVCVGANYGSGSLVGTGNIAISTSKFAVTGATGATRFLSLTGIDGSDLAIAASATTNQALTLDAGGSGTIGIGLTSTGNITIGATTAQIGLVATTVAITGNQTVSGNLTVGGSFAFAGAFVASAGIQVNGALIALDADDNSGIQSNANDDIDIMLGGSQEYSFETARLDMNNNDIEELGHILFVECGAYPAAGTVFIARENDGDLMLNCLTGKDVIIGLNAAEIAHFDAAGLAFAGAAAITTGATALTLTPTTDVLISDAKGLVVGGAQLSVSGGAAPLTPELQIVGTAQADGSLAVYTASATANAAVILARDKAAALGGHDIVADNDVLGDIEFCADDGVDTNTICARIRGEVDDASPAVSDIGGALAFFTHVGGSADNISEKMRLSAAGDLSISNGGGLFVGNATPVTSTALAEVQILGTAAADTTLVIGHWAAAATGGAIDFVKSNNGTIGSPTIVADNDVLGTIRWCADDGVNFATVAASVHAEVDDAALAADSVAAALVFSTGIGVGADDLSEKMRITPSGQIQFNICAHAAATQGLVADQAGNDDYILVFKSSDVATGLTSIVASANNVETDDYFAIDKFAAATGGVRMAALGENAAVTSNLVIESYGGQPDTTKTAAAGRGLVEIYASQHDGANALSNITNDGNVMAVRCRKGGADVSVMIVDEDGDVHVSGDLDANAGKVYAATSPSFTIAPNYVQAGGVNNAITVTLTDKAGSNLAETDGMVVLVDLGALTLQAGANTCQLTGAAARAIKTASNPATDIAAKVANAFIMLVYSSTSTAWLVLGE